MRGLLIWAYGGLVAVSACSGPLAPSAAPVATSTIQGGSGTPPIAIQGFTPLTFVGEQSTGQGLTCAWDFGGGATSTQPVAVFVSHASGPKTATLTVTDWLGRRSTTSASYSVVSVDPGRVGWWEASLPGNRWVSLAGTTRDGAQLTGTYTESGWGLPTSSRPFTGTLTGTNTITIRTVDGLVELTGIMDWVDGPLQAPNTRVGLRLTARGGMADGLVIDFKYDDPY